MMPTVFLTRVLPDLIMEKIRRHFRLRFNRADRPLSKKEILAGIKMADGLISMLSDPIDREVIDAAPRLRIIANYAVGYNNIDLKAAAERGIAVTNTPGVLTETTADLTWALIFAVARRLPEAERLARSGKWTGWAPTQLLGSDVFGKTLGIVGIGRIGQAVARRAAGFSMRLLYHSRKSLPRRDEAALNVSFVPFSRLLKESDFISLHLPLTNESHHLIDRRALASMKPTAFLINTARGPIVDEKALIRALRTGHLAGAGLDVFEDEPSLSPALRKLNNVVLLPHVGSASLETRIRMGERVLENLLAGLSGKRPPNVIE
ncbi:MAG: D-glycerate dehydrogenase [Nitrospirae bacterium]|nr:D-glycerate dehydrogenase [Candidatus Manganitrophaceae bacterium]